MMTFRQSLIWTTALCLPLGAVTGMTLQLLHAPTVMYFILPAIVGGLISFGIQKYLVRHS